MLFQAERQTLQQDFLSCLPEETPSLQRIFRIYRDFIAHMQTEVDSKITCTSFDFPSDAFCIVGEEALLLALTFLYELSALALRAVPFTMHPFLDDGEIVFRYELPVTDDLTARLDLSSHMALLTSLSRRGAFRFLCEEEDGFCVFTIRIPEAHPSEKEVHAIVTPVSPARYHLLHAYWIQYLDMSPIRQEILSPSECT